MCSKKWANPVRPGRSFFDPTWYHERDVHDRRRVVLGQDHAQPVRQRRDRGTAASEAGRRPEAAPTPRSAAPHASATTRSVRNEPADAECHVISIIRVRPPGQRPELARQAVYRVSSRMPDAGQGRRCRTRWDTGRSRRSTARYSSIAGGASRSPGSPPSPRPPGLRCRGCRVRSSPPTRSIAPPMRPQRAVDAVVHAHAGVHLPVVVHVGLQDGAEQIEPRLDVGAAAREQRAHAAAEHVPVHRRTLRRGRRDGATGGGRRRPRRRPSRAC